MREMLSQIFPLSLSSVLGMPVFFRICNFNHYKCARKQTLNYRDGRIIKVSSQVSIFSQCYGSLSAYVTLWSLSGSYHEVLWVTGQDKVYWFLLPLGSPSLPLSFHITTYYNCPSLLSIFYYHTCCPSSQTPSLTSNIMWYLRASHFEVLWHHWLQLYTYVPNLINFFSLPHANTKPSLLSITLPLVILVSLWLTWPVVCDKGVIIVA